jgi:phosphatidate cytidylyltransferase
VKISGLGGRLAVGLSGIPVAIGAIAVGGWVLTALMAFMAGAAAWELGSLAEARGIRVFRTLSFVGAVLLVCLANVFRSFSAWAPWALGFLLLLLFISSVATLRYRTSEERPLLVAGLTVVGALYWGGGISFAILLRHFPELNGWPGPWILSPGPVLVAFPIAVTWSSDTAAFIFGSLWGRHKLAPAISPKKSIEGAIASLLTSILVGALMGGVFLAFDPDRLTSTLWAAGIGAILAITIQFGDLIESHFKREAGVKDSGTLFPGHGGALDRFDAMVFTLPLAYALVAILGGIL